MNIIEAILPLFKELIMKYPLWKIVLAVTVPIIAFTFADVLNAIVNVINAIKG